MYAEILENIGLSHDEAIVYELLLHKGASAIRDIHSLVKGITRPTLYNILRSLAKKGLIEETKQRGRALFVPFPPHNLLEFIGRQEQRSAQARASVSHILPLLEQSFILSSDKPGIKYLEGVDGIRQGYKDVLASGADTVYAFHSALLRDEDIISKDFYEWYVKEKKRKGMRTMHIYPKTEKNMIAVDTVDPLIQRRLIDPMLYSAASDIGIYGNKIILVSYNPQKPVGFIIENKDFADAMKQLFMIVWSKAESLGR